MSNPEAVARRAARLKAEGRCVSCGAVADRHRYCAVHRRKNSARALRSYYARKAHGARGGSQGPAQGEA